MVLLDYIEQHIFVRIQGLHGTNDVVCRPGTNHLVPVNCAADGFSN